MVHVKLILVIFIFIAAILIILYNNRKKLKFTFTNASNPPNVTKFTPSNSPKPIEITLPPLLPRNPEDKPKGERYSRIREILGNNADLIDSYRQSGCKDSMGEYFCRKTLETIFDLPFNKSRPRFLKNPETRRNLELDGYNEDLALAFEYQGVQHRIYPNKYHKTENEFKEQIRRDIFKKEKCNKYNIELLIIYDDEIVGYHEIPEYIANMLPSKFDGQRKDLTFK